MLSHDTYKDLIGLKSREVFGHSYKWLSEVPAIVMGEYKRADLVLIADYVFPYVRVIEVKTRYEDFYKAIGQLGWFRDKGLANYYIVALPRSIASWISYNSRTRLVSEGIGLLTFEERVSGSCVELVIRMEIDPKFHVRTTHWMQLYEELEKRGETKLAERLRKTIGRNPRGK